MSESVSTSMEALEKKRIDSLICTENAVRHHPETYAEIRAQLQQIRCFSLDISEYHKTAKTLSELLKILCPVGRDSVFEYFRVHIDPRIKGDPRYFRAMCLDLEEQISLFEYWRRERRCLRRLK